MSEQQSQTTGVCPHPAAVGKRWGDPLSEERQAELQGYLDRWAAETDHNERKGPFDNGRPGIWGLTLTGADATWLAEQSGHNDLRDVPNLHLEGAYLAAAHLEGAYLHGAHLEGAGLREAHLEHARLGEAHLEGADLREAFLERSGLIGAYLEGARLVEAHLEGAVLLAAHLEGADLRGAHLEGADLTSAWLDSKTVLGVAHFDIQTRLVDVHWSGLGAVNLTLINWDAISTLGDEQKVGRRDKASAYETAVRAYRQVSTQLRAQGMTEVADRFAYRAQVWQRRTALRRHRIPQYLGSLFLDLISGYGYRPMRSLMTYVLVVLGFAATYFALGGANGQPLTWNEAIVVSMTAFHGRGFFAAVFQPGDLQAAVAAAEAFIGLLIEIVFIATFTQRFFAR